MLISRIKSFIYPYLYKRQDLSLRNQDIIIKQNDELIHRLKKLQSEAGSQKDELDKSTEWLQGENPKYLIQQMAEQCLLLKNQAAIAKQTLHCLSRKVRCRSDKISCIFLVHNITAWDSLSPVYKAMRDDSSFHPTVASINKKFPGEVCFGGEDVVHEKLIEQNIEHIRLNSDDSYEDLDILKTINPDVIFRQSQWDADIPPAFASQEINFAHLAYVPYEIMNFLGNVDPNIENSVFHKHCSMLFVANEYAYDSLKESSGISEERIFVTGHPKVEKLLSSEGTWPISWPDGRRNYRVLWGAHHSIEKNWSNFGTFLEIYQQMLEWAKENPQIDIVFSPHPALLTTLESEKYDHIRHNIDLFFKEWNDLPNTMLFENNTYGAIFKASDALIIDGISWLLEYQILEKPVVFLERNDHLPFLTSGEIIAKSVCRVSDFNGVKEAINNFMTTSQDCYKQQRKTTLNELLNIKKASENILKEIKDSLR
ncbi:hypothetical protein IRM71_07485 [Erwinia amylovora]|uniref:hypothetical protein n=1 Tax=Erwinia amylovora TaxID=552 RepID=UPI000C07669A|nr:hypothetical protein [Erwinia amylovora]UDJ85488.1 hypothetical protein IRM68_10375 [Erwinia amylovora]UDK00131.1 hypothetical protein IRM69_06345 [Erwinia amylovora]UDK90984.1 hypothetical protein IRM70_07495 [Erwinia amylovora]UDK94379.1 hypothetical protein IRM71_07485 [Erwinia amylovora]UOD75221.1 hypothetical protein IRM67_02610 [Erwinia amylovora]